MITLICSQIRDKMPDILLLQDFEKYCAAYSGWKSKHGPVLFAPRKISSRLYTLIHKVSKPVLRMYKKKGAVISIGFPTSIYMHSKTFPYFTYKSDLRVLWSYDVWSPQFEKIEKLVRKSKINLLLLSSYQATEHFKNLYIPNCEVQWVPESVNVHAYKHKPWYERNIDILSFGRSYLTYHDAIIEGCEKNHINYRYQERDEKTDVAVHGLKRGLQFPDWETFVDGLSDSKICICFPRSVTHPKLAGYVSTLTIRYLQAMASKCLIIGSAPLDVIHLLDYNPVVEVDWNDPVAQIQSILHNPDKYNELIDKNYNTVCQLFHHDNAMRKIELLINKKLAKTEIEILNTAVAV